MTERILQQLKKKGVHCNSNDNIADYLDGNDLEDMENEVIEKFESVLRSLVIDTENDPNTKETARRLAKTYIHELMRGRYYPKPDITAFPNQHYDGMLVVRAELRSLCAHHHQTMKGVAYIGIIPNGTVLGLSKYVRLAQWIARRGQIQEELTTQIAREIASVTRCENVGVYVAMSHDCVENRGVAAHSSLTQTTILLGEFKQAHVKEEFMHSIHMQELSTDAR